MVAHYCIVFSKLHTYLCGSPFKYWVLHSIGDRLYNSLMYRATISLYLCFILFWGLHPVVWGFPLYLLRPWAGIFFSLRWVVTSMSYSTFPFSFLITNNRKKKMNDDLRFCLFVEYSVVLNRAYIWYFCRVVVSIA